MSLSEYQRALKYKLADNSNSVGNVSNLKWSRHAGHIIKEGCKDLHSVG